MTDPILTRFAGNPILGDGDVPYARGLVYNGSVIKYEGRYVMLVRVDHADVAAQKMEGITTVALAFSDDGIAWQVQPEPAFAWRDDEIVAPSDPRLMLVEGRPHVSVAVETKHGMQTYLLTTEDFYHYDLLFQTLPESRDIVLFPEKIGGKYLRLERPFPTFGHGHQPIFDLWASESPDMTYWGRPSLLLDVDHVPYANNRIGAGTPPHKTDRGWALLFHAVDDDPQRGKNGWEEKWTKRYTSGILLLDLGDPRRVIGLSPVPLLAPEAPYETENCYRNDIVFPCGWVWEDTGEVKIYYGAGDTAQCLASIHRDDLLGLCKSLPPAT